MYRYLLELLEDLKKSKKTLDTIVNSNTRIIKIEKIEQKILSLETIIKILEERRQEIHE